MSQKIDASDAAETCANENSDIEPSDSTETNNGCKNEQATNDDQKTNIDPVAVRRQSQNSENNGNDGVDSITPVHTDDNDEVEQFC